MSRCSSSLIINFLNQSEGLPVEAESRRKENLWTGLCRKAKHTGFRKNIALNLFSLLSGRIPVLCETSSLPCWNQLCHALSHRARSGQHHHQLCQGIWCKWVVGEHCHWKHGTDGIFLLAWSSYGSALSCGFPRQRCFSPSQGQTWDTLHCTHRWAGMILLCHNRIHGISIIVVITHFYCLM